MAFEWYTEKFRELLNKNNVFEKIIDQNFGESKVVYFPIYGNGKQYDVRESLKIKGATEPLLRSALNLAGVKATDDMDVKVEKIRDFVNKRLTYTSDQANYLAIDYWADPYTVYDKKKDDCDGYAVLIMTLMRLAGIPAWRRRIVVGMVATGEAHAYVVYFTRKNNMWCVVEGSYFADDAKSKFNSTPFLNNFRYTDVMFCFNEEKSWSATKTFFSNLIPGGEGKDDKKRK